MPQSLCVLSAHIIFSTKQRYPWLTDEIRPQLFAYMAGGLKSMDCYSITVGGVKDHVHVLCHLTKKLAPIKVIQELKKESSKWIKAQGEKFKDFQWQDGYGMFSVSANHFEAVKIYVLGQEEHHKTVTFQEGFLRILKKNNAAYDEKYLWD